MSTSSVTLSHNEGKKLADYLVALEYEYALILADLQTDEERDSFRIKSDRTSALAAEVGKRPFRPGPISLARPTFAACLIDLDWLVEEWIDAVKYMDNTDAAAYLTRLAALERFLADIRDR